MVVRKRLKLEGRALVFVTTTVNSWLPLFQDEQMASIIVDQLRDTLTYYQTSLVGYVIMPSHVHMLLGFEHVERLSKFMHSFKILTAKTIRQHVPANYRQALMTDQNFRLWRPRFDDLIIYSEEQLRVKLEYIHRNPVKAGFVENAGDWQYSSASDWLGKKCGPLPIDKNFGWAG